MGASTNIAIRARGLRYSSHGLPKDVLEEVELATASPGPGEALVAMRAAAIHYSDLGMINGTYGRLPALPAIAGREGVGEVVALGAGVNAPAVGAIVRMPADAGAWREAVVAKAEELFPILPGVPLEQAAMAFINPPTAWILLRHFAELKAGDWLVQNAGSSAVGFLVAQLSRHLGFNCISVVRNTSISQTLLEAGATKVVAEDSGYEKQPAALTDGAPIKLALNAIGGESVVRLCRTISPGGKIVTYGAVATEPTRFPTRYLIFNDISLHGFWLDQWIRSHSFKEVHALWASMLKLLGQGVISQPIGARYKLADWQAALDHAFCPGKVGKVLLVSDWKL